jgi:multiple sugar transport system substrate-binding protein
MTDPRSSTSRRRFLGGLAAFGGAALLAACGTPSRPTEVPKPAAPPTTAPAAPATAAAKPADKPADAPKPAGQPAAAGTGAKILLRLNGISPPIQEYTNKLIADYNREKGVAVEIDYTDWASSFQKITTGIAGGTAPDIFMGGGLWHAVMPARGGSLDLDGYVKNMKDWNDFFEVARQDVTIQGKVVAMPYRANSRGNVVYRKSLFEKAGLDPKKPPTTWEEAQQYAAKLTQKQGDRFDVSGWYFEPTPPNFSQQYEDFLFQAGGGYFNEERTRPTNSTPEGEEALSYLVSFIEKGYVPKQGMDSGVPNLQAFSAGKVALNMTWPGFINNARLFAQPVFEDTVAAPPLKKKVQSLQLYIDKYFIYRRSKVPDESWQLIEALSVPAVNNRIGIEADWGLPVRKASADTSEVYKDPRMAVIVDNMKFGRIRQAVPQHFDVQPAMGREVEAAMQGVKTVKQALKDMDDEVTKILKS